MTLYSAFGTAFQISHTRFLRAFHTFIDLGCGLTAAQTVQFIWSLCSEYEILLFISVLIINM